MTKQTLYFGRIIAPQLMYSRLLSLLFSLKQSIFIKANKCQHLIIQAFKIVIVVKLGIQFQERNDLSLNFFYWPTILGCDIVGKIRIVLGDVKWSHIYIITHLYHLKLYTKLSDFRDHVLTRSHLTNTMLSYYRVDVLKRWRYWKDYLKHLKVSWSQESLSFRRVLVSCLVLDVTVYGNAYLFVPY